MAEETKIKAAEVDTKAAKEQPKVDTKAMLKDLAEKGTKVKFTDRVKLEIVKDTKFYKKGQVINPHVTFGAVLVKEGIAKKVKVD